MSISAGYVNGSGAAHPSQAQRPPHDPQLPSEKIKYLIAELEVPFDPAAIEWRVTNTSKDKKRGQIIPYADQRAYTDRLNLLFTPGGWTRRYTVHTSPNFERGQDKKTVAKVFVTCEVTIFGIGSHSATGEEWADDENAGTSAEAQAFKRTCACFGLGRYLYHFIGVWVDLDEHKRPKTRPQLFGWATPQGWREGLRPNQASPARENASIPAAKGNSVAANAGKPVDTDLTRAIESMQESIGRYMYRGLLRLARAWKPSQIQDAALQRQTLDRMRSAERGLRRLEAALERVDSRTVTATLQSLKIPAIERVDNLDTLLKLVLALEAAAK
jgi:hypothetical protein